MGISEFLEYVYAGAPDGYIALSLFSGGKPLKERFLATNQINLITDAEIQSLSKEGDLYFTPAVFKVPERTRSAAIGACLAWADVDVSPGHSPAVCPSDSLPDAPALSVPLRISSGSDGHEHIYYRSERFLKVWEVEAWNHKLALEHHADLSGWDCTQLLRMPGSLNHKTSPPKPVSQVNGAGGIFAVPPLTQIQIPTIVVNGNLDAVKLLQERELDKLTRNLLAANRTSDRGKGLYELSCRLFEQGWTAPEVKSVLVLKDTQWGKFSNRSDGDIRLDEIIAKTIFKQRTVIDVLDETESLEESIDTQIQQRELLRRTPRGFLTLRKTALPIEFIVEGVLRKRGLLYAVGPTGVGKSTFALNMAARLAMRSEEWAGFKLDNSVPQKILYGSHEMDEEAIMYFMEGMLEHFRDDLLQQLEDNLKVMTYGQTVPLDEDKPQKAYEAIIKEGNYTGFIIDTLGASTSTSLQDEGSARKIADWIDKIRQKYGIWVAVLAHPRKLPAGTKLGTAYVMDDFYGSRIFGDRSDSVLVLQRQKGSNTVEVRAEKTRFAGGTQRKYLKRSNNHWFGVDSEFSETSTPQQQPSKPTNKVIDVIELDPEDFTGEGDDLNF